jgi:hypothetical protein
MARPLFEEREDHVLKRHVQTIPEAWSGLAEPAGKYVRRIF